MNPKYIYLTLNLIAFIFPFLFSFYPKANFSRQWKFLLPAIILPAIIFIIWDEIFTRMGIWGFNSRYISGFYILNLPVEEILFFVCIPYACVFTYFALKYLIEKDYLFPHQHIITSILAVTLLIIGVFHFDKWYTSVTFLLTGIFLSYQMLKLRLWFMGRFYMAFILILIPFFIINGILTGSFLHEPVVWYNDNDNMGIRLGTIPVEDIFYGMLLILMNITIFEWLQERYKTT